MTETIKFSSLVLTCRMSQKQLSIKSARVSVVTETASSEPFHPIMHLEVGPPPELNNRRSGRLRGRGASAWALTFDFLVCGTSESLAKLAASSLR